jgi:hypothetical protein
MLCSYAQPISMKLAKYFKLRNIQMSLENYVEETSFTLSNEAQQFMDAGLEEVRAYQKTDRIGQIALNNLACTTCNQEWFEKWETSTVTAEIAAVFNNDFVRMHLRVLKHDWPMSIQSTPARPINLISLQSDVQCVLEFFKFDDDMPSVHSGHLIPDQQPTETRLFTGITDLPDPVHRQPIEPYKFYKFRSDIPHRFIVTRPTTLNIDTVKLFSGTDRNRRSYYDSNECTIL